MKTKPNLKVFVKLLVAIMVTTAFWGCKDEEVDPRQSFVNTYEMDDFEVLLNSGSDDSLFTIGTNPELEFEMEDDLNNDELKVDLEEFIEDIIKGSLGAISPTYNLSYEFDEDDFVAEISGGKFEIDDFNFTLNATAGGSPETYNCSYEGEGELDGDELSVDFEITIFGDSGNVTFTGTAVGEVE